MKRKKKQHQMIIDASKDFACPYFNKGHEYFKDMKSKHMNILDYRETFPVEERYRIDSDEYHKTLTGKCEPNDNHCSCNKDGFCYRNHYPEKRCSSVKTLPEYNEEWTKRWMADRRKENKK